MSRTRCAIFKFIIPAYLLFTLLSSIWAISYGSGWAYITLIISSCMTPPYIWYCRYYDVDTGYYSLDEDTKNIARIRRLYGETDEETALL